MVNIQRIRFPIHLKHFFITPFRSSPNGPDIYLGLRRLCTELRQGLRVPRVGPLFSTIGAMQGMLEGSRAPGIRIRSALSEVTKTAWKNDFAVLSHSEILLVISPT